jgi:hypothetical protein
MFHPCDENVILLFYPYIQTSFSFGDCQLKSLVQLQYMLCHLFVLCAHIATEPSYPRRYIYEPSESDCTALD